jgi:peptide/nickel transport system permease protein
MAPGNPAEALLVRLERLGPVSPTAAKALEAAFGVNTTQPLWSQYLQYLNDLLHGNLGISFIQYPIPVATVIGQNIIWTIMLGAVSVVISFFVGCLIGIIMAWRRGSFLDTFLSPAMTFLSAIPYFWLALIILYFFGYTLSWFPFADGFDTQLNIGWNFDFIVSALYHAILPAFTIVISSIAGWMLVMRNSMITTLSEDYVLMANAKGLARWRVMFLYAARNAILPNIAGFALAIGFVIAGALVMEIVFSYPGIGYLLYNAVGQDDFPVMQGIFLAISATVLLACLLADVIYVIADPRTRRRAAF